MPRRFLFCIFAALVVFWFALTLLIERGGTDATTGLYLWVKVFREGVRTPLFSGCLTLGSFLLTLQATILLRIKEIYDSPEYQADWELFVEQMARAQKPVPSFYLPLQNLGVALLVNVFLSIVCSISQLTFGFSTKPWAVAICLSLGAVTLLCLLFLWWRIATNLMRWFALIEKKRETEKKAKP